MTTKSDSKPSASLRAVVPHGWAEIDALADRDQELERIAVLLTRNHPADSAAAARHRIRAELSGLLDSVEETPERQLQSFLFPVESVLGFVLPATVAISSFEPPEGDLTPVEVLVAISPRDPSSTPVPVGDTVALRTHSIRPVASESVEAATRSMVEETTDSDPASADFEVVSLRTNYVFGWLEPIPAWFVIAASALMPAAEASEALVEEYLGLFDLIVAGVSLVMNEPTS